MLAIVQGRRDLVLSSNESLILNTAFQNIHVFDLFILYDPREQLLTGGWVIFQSSYATGLSDSSFSSYLSAEPYA